uniref:Uncharacterized protein n=1 Tax=Arundo donax TaxID=35708 RepID=A0A0A9DX23_ARUDO
MLKRANAILLSPRLNIWAMLYLKMVSVLILPKFQQLRPGLLLQM